MKRLKAWLDTLGSLSYYSLLGPNLSISKARGQCYDGASAMRSAHFGVTKQIRDMKKELSIHIIMDMPLISRVQTQ